MTETRGLESCKASPNIIWQDIDKEIHDLRNNQLAGLVNGPFLRTCTVEYPEFIVSLSLQGAVKIIENLIKADKKDCPPHPYQYFAMVGQFAKEMVANRDREFYINECLAAGVEPDRRSFWPKT